MTMTIGEIVEKVARMQAESFVAKHKERARIEDTPDGWVLVSYQGDGTVIDHHEFKLDVDKIVRVVMTMKELGVI